MCYICMGLTKCCSVLNKQLLLGHNDRCDCTCAWCKNDGCVQPLNNISRFMKHMLCPPSPKFSFLPDEFYDHECVGTSIIHVLWLSLFFWLNPQTTLFFHPTASCLHVNISFPPTSYYLRKTVMLETETRHLLPLSQTKPSIRGGVYTI